MLRCKSSSRRADEGTTCRDDRPQSESDQGLVPKQKVQRQEENHTAENADATGEGGN